MLVLMALPAISIAGTYVYCNDCHLPPTSWVMTADHYNTKFNQLYTADGNRDGIWELHSGLQYYAYQGNGPGYVDINHPAFYSKPACENRSNNNGMHATCKMEF